ncbi:MAG TPA: polymorphic toxin-type HINT domain-containing protein [Pirellulaceae bacterium]|nr:polymorphic toxin-type HINT domain-containing protein [Pirellulaceae bacterium]
MVWTIRLSGVLCSVVFGFSAVGTGAEPSESAESLVEQALVAELGGDLAQRRELLEAAIAMSPEYAPARWHVGMVRTDDAWLPVEEAEQQATKKGLVFEYRQLRDRYSGTAAGQEMLARWCLKKQWTDLEKMHWANVLSINPNHHDARSRLGVREYRGMLLTKEQIDQYKEGQKAYDRAMGYWKPHLRGLQRAIEGSDEAAREVAMAELRAIDDGAAIPAVEEVLLTSSELLGVEAVGVIGRIKGQAAVDSLIRQAVLSDHEAVRKAATDQLQLRSWFSYVPAMLSELRSPVELSYFAQTFGGGIHYGYEAVQERPEGTYTVERSHSILLTVAAKGPARRGHVLTPAAVARTRGAAHSRYSRDSSLLTALGRQAENTNHMSTVLNSRILSVLRCVTQQQLSNDPRDWWQWWANYNELHQPRRIHRNRVDTSQVLVAQLQPNSSCFLPGTLVWTETGSVPIEKVRAGDRVLSQHPETGELTYKLVIDTTVRPPSTTLRLGLGEEEIATTLGHPLWVAGNGWLMAKELKVGDLLHGVHGSLPIDYIEAGPESEAFNLVVADFSTYFIGQHRILVHDNRARLATDAALPGFTSSKE